jgi:hypothetical protein
LAGNCLSVGAEGSRIAGISLFTGGIGTGMRGSGANSGGFAGGGTISTLTLASVRGAKGSVSGRNRKRRNIMAACTATDARTPHWTCLPFRLFRINHETTHGSGTADMIPEMTLNKNLTEKGDRKHSLKRFRL